MCSQNKTELVNTFLTLVKVHPGKKYSTMVMEATITRNNTQTTMVRAEGREHDLREIRVLTLTNSTNKDGQEGVVFMKKLGMVVL